jgi:hypothetical protein
VLYLLVNGGFAIYAGFAGSGPPNEQPFRLVGGGIGLATGLLGFAQPLLSTTSTPASFTILGVGLLLSGIVDLAGLVVERGGLAARLGRVLAGGCTCCWAYYCCTSAVRARPGARCCGSGLLASFSACSWLSTPSGRIAAPAGHLRAL